MDSSSDSNERLAELQRLIRTRTRLAVLLGGVFVLSFAVIVLLARTAVRQELPLLLWLVHVVAMIALGGAIIVGAHVRGLIRMTCRTEANKSRPS